MLVQHEEHRTVAQPTAARAVGSPPSTNPGDDVEHQRKASARPENRSDTPRDPRSLVSKASESVSAAQHRIFASTAWRAAYRVPLATLAASATADLG